VKTGRGVRQGCNVSLILFNLYSEYLTKEALVGFGYFKIRGEAIHNVKYTEDILLLAKKETVIWGVIDRLTEIRRRYGLEMNVEKNEGNENLKATTSDTDYDISKTTAECGIFQLLW